VGGALWAAFAFAPSSAPGGGAARSSRAAGPAPAAAESSLGQAAAAVPHARPEGDRLLVVPESRPAPAPSPSPAAAIAAAPAAAKPRFAPPRLKATAPIVSVNDRAQTSAFMPAASDAAAGDVSAAQAASSAVSRSLAARGEPAAAAVHYGVVDRASLMGRGAGPVYNLRGTRSARGSVRYGAQAPASAAAAAAPTAESSSSDDDAQ